MLRVLILLVALSAGGLALWMSLGTSAAPTAVVGPTESKPMAGMAEVLVAATDLAPGSLIDPAGMRWQPWPQGALNEAFITREQRPDAMEAFGGLVARSGLTAGEPIHDAKLSAGDAGALSVILTPGMRAVAVRISAENSAGGFILPNNRVDVLLTTTHTDTAGATKANSQVILRNVKVLAVDQNIDGSSGAVVGKTATLELKPEEVEIVTAAESTGAVSLALRALADQGEDPVVHIAEKRTLKIFRAGQMEVVAVD